MTDGGTLGLGLLRCGNAGGQSDGCLNVLYNNAFRFCTWSVQGVIVCNACCTMHVDIPPSNLVGASSF